MLCGIYRYFLIKKDQVGIASMSPSSPKFSCRLTRRRDLTLSYRYIMYMENTLRATIILTCRVIYSDILPSHIHDIDTIYTHSCDIIHMYSHSNYGNRLRV